MRKTKEASWALVAIRAGAVSGGDVDWMDRGRRGLGGGVHQGPDSRLRGDAAVRVAQGSTKLLPSWIWTALASWRVLV